MTDPRHVVIVGSGLAGASAAAALRERGFAGKVTLFGQDRYRPYELPALSKGILLGDTDHPDWVHEEGFYPEHDIELRMSSRITQLRPDEQIVVDSEGNTHHYDRLLLATGSKPKLLPVPGGDRPGLLTLRTLDDANNLRTRLVSGARVVVVGGGWIGCEVAAAARSHDAHVTVVESLALPLHRVLGNTIGEVFRDLHAEHGVHWHLGTGIESISGGVGETEVVTLSDGTELTADVVVVAVGAAPDITLATEAGLTIADDGGVAVDAALRTSVPEIYAAGDIASHAHPRYGKPIRVEHWANAKDQGAHVAGSLLGGEDPYTASPYFFSDQYDLGLEYRGIADPDACELVVRGDLAGREFIAFWLSGGTVEAALNVNSWDDGDALGALVDNNVQVTGEQLRDADLGTLS
jgi:3-phenylpropionate/trans-cinnamate dioxygenase ferredoxin reductase subunit